jgi:hypothetical protein
VVAPTSAGTFTIPAHRGHSYLVQQVADPAELHVFAMTIGAPSS